MKNPIIGMLHLVFIGALLVQAEDLKSVGTVKLPNVIVVMTDFQGYGDLGCHCNRFFKTLELHQLHAKSVRFTDFHVRPFCTPTRAALMTGNHPAVTVVYCTSSGCMIMHSEVDLPTGATEFVTYLYDAKGKAGGAYFTDVECLDNL